MSKAKVSLERWTSICSCKVSSTKERRRSNRSFLSKSHEESHCSRDRHWRREAIREAMDVQRGSCYYYFLLFSYTTAMLRRPLTRHTQKVLLQSWPPEVKQQEKTYMFLNKSFRQTSFLLCNSDAIFCVEKMLLFCFIERNMQSWLDRHHHSYCKWRRFFLSLLKKLKSKVED